MRSSRPLYDALAPTYEEHFAVPHRRAYDALAWEICLPALPAAPGLVVDVGCGVGRWSRRLSARGYRVIGVEPAPEMAARAAQRGGAEFVLRRDRVEDVDLATGSVDAVVAMGSLQYTADPARQIARCAAWLRPGGVLCVLVDSLHALVVELVAAGRTTEALQRLASRRGVWRVGTHEADHHLLDAAALSAAVVTAGLGVERVAGLLVGATALGRQALTARLTDDFAAALAVERRLAAAPELADLGKQLLVVGRAALS